MERESEGEEGVDGGEGLVRAAPQTTRPPRRKRASEGEVSAASEKRKEDERAKRDVARLLAEGKYRSVASTSTTSEAWKKFGRVQDVATGELLPYVVCLGQCKMVKMYKRRSGTTGMADHVCPLPPPSAPTATVVASPDAKKSFTSAMVNLVAAKLLPPSIVEDEFFHALLQECIIIGASSGKVDIKTLAMDHKTLTRAIKKTADNARRILIEEIGEAVDDGLASATVDAWKESKTSRKYLAHTVSLIDESFVMNDHVLCTPHIDAESVTGDVLRETIKTNKLQLGLSKDASLHYGNYRAITDPSTDYYTSDFPLGSDIVAALKEEDRSYCMDHCVSLCVKKPFEAKLSKTDLYREGVAGHLINTLQKCVNIIKNSRIQKYRGLRTALVKGPANRPSSSESQRVFRSSLPMLRSVRKNYKQVKECLTDMGHGEELQGISAKDIADTDILVAAVETIGRKHDNCFRGDDHGELEGGSVAAEGDRFTCPNISEAPPEYFYPGNLPSFKVTLPLIIGSFLFCCCNLYRLVHQVIKKCKEIVTYMKASGLNGRKEGGTLKQEVETRWLSHLHLLRSFFVDVKVHPTLTKTHKIAQINDLLSERGKADLVLSEDDVKLMSDMIPLLAQFEKAVKVFEAEKIPTIQHVLPQHKILQAATAPHPGDSVEISRMRRLMSRQIKEKFGANITVRHKLGAFFTPQFKSLQTLLTEAEIAEARVEQGQASSDSEDEFAGLHDAPTTERPQDELEKYLDLPVPPAKHFNLLEWWKNQAKDFPALSRVVRMGLATPASSAASERHFSNAGRLITDRRTRFAPETVDAILFLRDFIRKGYPPQRHVLTCRELRLG
ncbi:Transposable element Hobo transposase [Frankliniella fusca]|uniref:Transposable element Hobo transposase n=1 Tax=Frankliniella fusca TaxID=407009 RepID=A0AAE1LDT4_9NEOP|nr:Transposable element Hobo transposase [Frankliniella fusca]